MAEAKQSAKKMKRESERDREGYGVGGRVSCVNTSVVGFHNGISNGQTNAVATACVLAGSCPVGAIKTVEEFIGRGIRQL